MQTQDKVVYTTIDGSTVVATVDYIWKRTSIDSRPPLVNLHEDKSGEKHTSVPHKSDVVGASSCFYQ